MNAPPKLVVLDGGKCPEAHKQSVLKSLDVRIAEISAELCKLTDSALFELDAEGVHTQLGCAVGCLHLARIEIAKEVRR